MQGGCASELDACRGNGKEKREEKGGGREQGAGLRVCFEAGSVDASADAGASTSLGGCTRLASRLALESSAIEAFLRAAQGSTIPRSAAALDSGGREGARLLCCPHRGSDKTTKVKKCCGVVVS